MVMHPPWSTLVSALKVRLVLVPAAVIVLVLAGGASIARGQPLLTPEQRDSLLRDMTPEQRQRLWQQLMPEQKAEIMRNLTPEQRASLAERMTPEQRERLRERLQDDRIRRDGDGGMRGRLSAEERQRLREQIIDAQRERRDGPYRQGGRHERMPQGGGK